MGGVLEKESKDFYEKLVL